MLVNSFETSLKMFIYILKVEGTLLIGLNKLIHFLYGDLDQYSLEETYDVDGNQYIVP